MYTTNKSHQHYNSCNIFKKGENSLHMKLDVVVCLAVARFFLFTSQNLSMQSQPFSIDAIQTDMNTEHFESTL